MRIESLEYFVDFAQTGSVTETAGHFYLSTQGMNRALHQLEKESGYVLLSNQDGSLRLTEAGRRFSTYARKIVEEKRDMQRDMLAFSQHADERKHGIIRILATPAANSYFVPELDLQQPGMFDDGLVLLREHALADCTSILSNLVPEGTMGVVTFPVGDKYHDVASGWEKKGLVFEPLATSRVVALVSTASPLAQRGTFVAERDLPQVRCGLLADETLLDYVDDTIRDEYVRTVTSNYLVLKEQIQTNRIVVFVPSVFLSFYPSIDGICALEFAGSPEMMLGMLTPQQNMDDALLGLVRKTIRQKIAAMAASARYRGNVVAL